MPSKPLHSSAKFIILSLFLFSTSSVPKRSHYFLEIIGNLESPSFFQPTLIMKKSGLFAASVAAASATAVTVSSTAHNSHNQDGTAERRGRDVNSSSEKFAPRFDGLRFIETLVTAHR